ncbi:hypothetical protein U1Q18_032016, partial [Sarracenia purpurea var. burkii]
METGTKTEASDWGLGAGASAATTLCTAETAMIITTRATKSFIFNASILSVRNVRRRERKRDLRFLFVKEKEELCRGGDCGCS